MVPNATGATVLSNRKILMSETPTDRKILMSTVHVERMQ